MKIARGGAHSCPGDIHSPCRPLVTTLGVGIGPRFLFRFSVGYEHTHLCINSNLLCLTQILTTVIFILLSKMIIWRPGTCFSKVLVTFQAQKAALCLPRLHWSQIFNNFEENETKLSVNEAKWTGLWARDGATIQLVWILKFVFGPKKFTGLSRNWPLSFN